MIERTTEAVASGWNLDDPSHDTISLLMEEIERLESELRSRDEALRVAPASDYAEATHDQEVRDEGLLSRVAELSAELASRDETVTLLLEQAQLFEEAAEAQRAEWEQLNQWVEEVERRVDDKDVADAGLREDLESERLLSESLRRLLETDRRTWEAQRLGLERESEHLRGQLARQQTNAPVQEEETAFIAMAAENRRLRTANAELERAATEAAALSVALDSARAALEQSHVLLRQAEDDCKRQQNEYEAEISSVRSRIALESLRKQDDPQETVSVEVAPVVERSSPLEADERIRAFRQHLRELHDHETEQRSKQTLSARLSRLWRNTGPG